MSKLPTVTDASFKGTVTNSNTPVLVEFGAEWCPPCRMLEPVLAEIAHEHKGSVSIVTIDTDENPNAAIEFGVQGLPTMILFKDGKPVERMVGYMPKPRLLQKIEPHFAKVAQ